MAICKKCDRCGRYYDRYGENKNAKKINGIATLNLDSNRQYYMNDILDLCPECSKSFNSWLNEWRDNSE